MKKYIPATIITILSPLSIYVLGFFVNEWYKLCVSQNTIYPKETLTLVFVELMMFILVVMCNSVIYYEIKERI